MKRNSNETICYIKSDHPRRTMQDSTYIGSKGQGRQDLEIYGHDKGIIDGFGIWLIIMCYMANASANWNLFIILTKCIIALKICLVWDNMKWYHLGRNHDPVKYMPDIKD